MSLDGLGLWNQLPFVAGGAGIVAAVFFYIRVNQQPAGNDAMNRIAGYIQDGAMAFLRREYQVLAGYILVVSILMGVFIGWAAAAAFAAGSLLSLLAGFCGMRAATLANVRTAQAARTGKKSNALLVALDGGAVMGLGRATTRAAGLAPRGRPSLYIFRRRRRARAAGAAARLTVALRLPRAARRR